LINKWPPIKECKFKLRNWGRWER